MTEHGQPLCDFIAESGHRAGARCGKQSRFDVAGRRVCGRHVGRAVEQASKLDKPAVAVTPDFYDNNPPVSGGSAVSGSTP